MAIYGKYFVYGYTIAHSSYASGHNHYKKGVRVNIIPIDNILLKYKYIVNMVKSLNFSADRI